MKALSAAGAFFLFLQLLCLPAAFSQMTKATESPEWEIQIKAEKSGFAVGEAVSLEISLRNRGSTTLKIPKFFMLPADDPNKNNLQIQIQDQEGRRLSRVSHVLTGRALYYPDIITLGPGETYRDFILLAGTFVRKEGRKQIEQALWSLGENPEVTSASEYPPMAPGTFEISVVYSVTEQQLAALTKAESSTVWTGQLTSNILTISVR